MAGPLAGFRQPQKTVAETPVEESPVVVTSVSAESTKTDQKQKKKPYAKLRFMEFVKSHYSTMIFQWRPVDDTNSSSPMSMTGTDGVTRVLCQLWRHKSVKVLIGVPNEPIDPKLEKWWPIQIGGCEAEKPLEAKDENG